jgi:hypothetical protein
MTDLVFTPETGNVLLIVLHIGPALELLHNFGFIMEGFRKHLDDRHISS